VRTRTVEQSEKILTVAVRLFATQRFHEARMEDIAAAAEVGKGTLYRYFKDKEELYLALLDRAADGLQHALKETLDKASGPYEKLVGLVRVFLGYFDENPHLLDLITHAEAMRRPDADFSWDRTRQTNMRLTREILDEGAAAGVWDVRAPDLAVLMLLGGLRALMRFSPGPRPSCLAERLVQDFLLGADKQVQASCGWRASAQVVV
jgi:AcrR family transcriptional regulator